LITKTQKSEDDFIAILNPIEAGGGVWRPTYKKALENSFMVEMHVHSPISHSQLKEKNIRPITLIVWVLGEGGKIPNKG